MHKIASIVMPGELVFDIGANIGTKAEWFAARQARVVAVEPQPAMVQTLTEKFARHPLVSIVPKGVGSEAGTLSMSINTAEPVLSTFSSAWKEGRFHASSWDQEITVDITTLDALVASYGPPRYIKIDVEGFEKQVVRGLSRKVGALSFEFTSELIEDSVEVCATLDALGYEYYNFSIGEDEDYRLDQWTSSENVLATLHALIKNYNLLWGDIYAF